MSDDERGKVSVAVVAGQRKRRGFSSKPGTPETTAEIIRWYQEISDMSSNHNPNHYPDTPALCSEAVLVTAALLCVNTFSQPSPISDLNASIRARNASASLISLSIPSSTSTSSGFVVGVSNTDAETRPRRAADRRDDTLTLIECSEGG